MPTVLPRNVHNLTIGVRLFLRYQHICQVLLYDHRTHSHKLDLQTATQWDVTQRHVPGTSFCKWSESIRCLIESYKLYWLKNGIIIQLFVQQSTHGVSSISSQLSGELVTKLTWTLILWYSFNLFMHSGSNTTLSRYPGMIIICNILEYMNLHEQNIRCLFHSKKMVWRTIN